MKQTDIYNVCLACIPVLIIVAGLVWSIYRTHRETARYAYRNVKRREPATDGGGGEIIELECGHVFRLTHFHRASFACEACSEEKRT